MDIPNPGYKINIWGPFTELEIGDFDLLLYCHKFNIPNPKLGEILEGLVSNIRLPIGVLISQISDDLPITDKIGDISCWLSM